MNRTIKIAEGMLDLIGELPLVRPNRIGRELALKADLARAEEGRAFVLHGGDCAERFTDCGRDTIVRKLKILLQMSLVVAHAGHQPAARGCWCL